MSAIVAPAGTTPEETAELERRRPVNWDELGSSARDLWVERNLRAMRKARARMPEECPSCGEPEPILYKGEEGERDAVSCPECGWTTSV